MKPKFIPLLLAGLAALAGVSSATAAEYQWSTTVDSVISTETNDHPRAFLWIPPNCQRLRGVVVGQHNMEEEPIFENPKFRAALSDLGFAEIWVTPGWNLFFRFDQGAAEQFDDMIKSLAAASGYSELATVPVVPIGHSATASYPWNFAALRPERTLAVISVSGQWPYYKDSNTPDWGARTVDGVPGLVSMGDYEDAKGRAGTGLQQRAEHPQTVLSMLANPGGGHFESSDAKVEYLALYLKKAAHYRLPANWPIDEAPKLKPIDPTKTGWLADRWRRDDPPKAPAAPVAEYKGDPKDAFWFFDGELARATETYQAQHRGKKVQLLGYVQDGKIVEQNPRMHEQVPLKFLPMADGISFKLTGAFLDTVPPGRPEGWTGLSAGSPVTHASGGGPVVIVRNCGPVIQTAPDTWQIHFDRVGTNNRKRSNAIGFFALHPGDANYRPMVQQSVMWFPLRNTEGAAQQITFEPIPDQRLGAKTLKLLATSNSGMTVKFYVREGPAEITGDTLTFTPVPPRAKLPIKITVVAWQWGRSIDPKLKSAEPVEKTFLLTK